MNTKKLKQLVLDLAIHGKLVPQDPNDEPASELLKRIVETHGRASNFGRASNKKSAISSDNLNDVPFEVSEGWVWCKVTDVLSKITDGTHHSPTNLPQGEYMYITAKNIKPYGVDLTDVTYVDKATHDEIYSRCNPEFGDILYIKDGATTGIACINNIKEPFSLLSSVALLKPCEFINAEFLLRYLQSSYCYSSVRETMKGVGITRITLKLIGEWSIPLPPLSEQKRIVSEIEKWFGIIDQIESNEADLRKSIEQTKKKVLDLAIHGKLVEQDPNDEPASELLKRIVETRGRASNKKSAISSEEIDDVPFEVPEGWVWTKLKSICCKLVDGDHNPPVGEKEPTKYLMASSKNINNDKLVDLDDVRFLSENCFRECDKRTKVSIGDIAITSVGTLGRTCIIKEKINLTFQRSVTVLSLIFVDNRYVKYVLDSSYIQKFMLENSRGTAQQGFYINQMEELLIPLPPLSEQRRIVAKIEEVFGELDRIEEMIG